MKSKIKIKNKSSNETDELEVLLRTDSIHS